MEDNKKGLTGVIMDGANRLPPGVICQYKNDLSGMLNREHPEEPTPIQRQIERAVTNGRGYLEKDSIRYSSVPYMFAETWMELPTAKESGNARAACEWYERENAPLSRAIWLGLDFENLSNDEISPLKGVTR